MAIFTSIGFSDGIYECACSAAGISIEKNVLINGSSEDNSFTLVISDDWIVCRRERNMLYITVKRNYKEDARVGYLNVTSTQDNRASATLEITQSGDTLSLTCISSITFPPYPAQPVICDVEVTAEGGNGKFGIKRIDKYLSGDIVVDYDYGLKIEKIENPYIGIEVINYGKVPIEENFDRYEIVLYHLDKPELMAVVQVVYLDTTNNVSWVSEYDSLEDEDKPEQWVIELPVVSDVKIVPISAMNNEKLAEWSIVDVVKGKRSGDLYVKDAVNSDIDWLKCTTASDVLVMEYGEAEIGEDYIAIVTLNCYGSTREIVVIRNTDVEIHIPQNIPINKRSTSYPVGIIVLDEISDDVYEETPLEETVSLIVPWDVEEFDIPLLTRYYEDEYTPFPRYDSNIRINNKSRWMDTSLLAVYGEVYSEPIEGEEQIDYGTVQVKILTVTVKNNYTDMDRTYVIRLKDAQIPSNTINLKITQTTMSEDFPDDSSTD